MKLEQSFEVDAPLERVWEALIDVERVAPCLPGAAVTGRNDDGTYNGTFTIKIGPTTASYTGKLEMQNIDESAHSAAMHAQGSDRRGQGGATATILSTLTAAGDGTKVEVVTDYHITGRLARFGRGGMIEDISERLLHEFASRLQSSLGAGGGAEVPTAVHEIVSPEAPEEPEEAPPPTDLAAPTQEWALPEAAPEPEAEPALSAEPAPAAEVPAPPPAPAPEPPADVEAPSPAPEPESAPPARPEAPEEPLPPPPPPPPAAAAPPPPLPPPAAAAPPPPPPPPPPAAAAPSPPPRPTPVTESEPLDAGSLVGSVVVDRVKRNPKPVIAIAGGLLLLRLLRRRR